jgi:uncharacterized membrane protein YfcA
MLPIETIAFLVTGAALAGLVMGLVGFGTGLAALGFWLFVIDPALAVPLISICSLATTAFTFRVFSHAISWKRLAPFFIGGPLACRWVSRCWRSSILGFSRSPRGFFSLDTPRSVC